MCLAVPGRVMEVVDSAGRIGRVKVFGTPRLVNLGLLDQVAAGDWVLVQTAFAVEKIDEATALETTRLLEELGKAFEQALAPAGGKQEP